MEKRKNMPEKDEEVLKKNENDVWENLKQTRKKTRIEDSKKAEKDLEIVIDAMIEKFKKEDE